MGGHAIPNARRVEAAEYHALTARIDALLTAALPGVRFALIPAYRAKLDFGDADILVERDALPSDWPARVAAALNAGAHVPNGPVHSFDLEGFQVDLITTPAASFDFAYGYFAWNDLGNLIGRIAHKYRFKFGHEGLFYPLRDGDHLAAEVPVTRDFAQALTFLGLDPARWAEGFDTLKDVFAYVASSVYFDPAQFPLEHRSHRARVRDAKRPTYTKFLTWVAAQAPLAHAPAVTPAARLRAAREAFPAFREQHDLALARLVRHKAVAARFNGSLVSEWTGLCGKELGAFIRVLREDAGGIDALHAHLLSLTPAEVRDWVLAQVAAQRSIATDAEYRAALAEVAPLMAEDPGLDTPAGRQLARQVARIEAYEQVHFPMTPTPG